MKKVSFKKYPDSNGNFGPYGGRFVAETLMPLILELEKKYLFYKNDKKFKKEFSTLSRDYIGRPSPLYFAKNREVVVRDDEIYLYDDKRFQLKNTDEIKKLKVRFRTLGCYPLTAGIESDSDNLDKIIQELNETSYSERSGRAIDKDRIGSMEIKKKEGYF